MALLICWGCGERGQDGASNTQQPETVPVYRLQHQGTPAFHILRGLRDEFGAADMAGIPSGSRDAAPVVVVVTPPVVTTVPALREGYEALICQYTDWDCDFMVSVMYRGSGGNPAMWNPQGICIDGTLAPCADGIEHHAQGLLDMARPLHDHYFEGCDGSMPECQVLAGHRLFLDSGYAPWGWAR